MAKDKGLVEQQFLGSATGNVRRDMLRAGSMGKSRIVAGAKSAFKNKLGSMFGDGEGEGVSNASRALRLIGAGRTAEWYERFFGKSNETEYDILSEQQRKADQKALQKFENEAFKAEKERAKKEGRAPNLDYVDRQVQAYRKMEQAKRDAAADALMGIQKEQKRASKAIVGVVSQGQSGILKVVQRGFTGLNVKIDDVQDDVTDIKSLLMPKFVTARGERGTADEGNDQIAMYNPLAPQGQQFRQATQSGKVTALKPGKNFAKSAEGKAAVETVTLALAIHKKDQEKKRLADERKAELRKKYGFKEKEEKKKVDDPLVRIEAKVDEILEKDKKKEEEKKKTNWFWDLIKKIGMSVLLPVFGFFAKIAALGSVAAIAMWLGSAIYEWLAPKILDAMEWIHTKFKEGWAWVAEKYDSMMTWIGDKVDSFMGAVDAVKSFIDEKIWEPIKKVLVKLHIIKGEEEYKAEEKKNAAEGRTRGGVASTKGLPMVEAVAQLDKMANDPKNTPAQREQNAKARDHLKAQMEKIAPAKAAAAIAANAPATKTVTIESKPPTPLPPPKAEAVGNTGTLVDAAKTPSGDAKAGLIAAMDEAGITGSHRSQLLAQASHESGGFKKLEENLNYSPEALKGLFSYYKKHPEEADADGYEKKNGKIIRRANQQNIANKAYGNRNGNVSPDDGWKYRGRGTIQLTGKDNYKVYGEAIGIDLVKNPDLAAQPDIAGKVAVAYYKKNIIQKGISADDTKSVTRAVNGTKMVGLEERQQLFTQNERNAASTPPIMSTTPSPEVRMASVTPAQPLPAVSADKEARSLMAFNSPANAGGGAALVNAPTVVQNNNVTTNKRPAQKASVLSDDRTLNRTLGRDVAHPVYG